MVRLLYAFRYFSEIMENGSQTTPHLPVSLPRIYVEYPIKMKEKKVSLCYAYSRIQITNVSAEGLISHVSRYIYAKPQRTIQKKKDQKENITNSMLK